jgi:hypothetical protein
MNVILAFIQKNASDYLQFSSHRKTSKFLHKKCAILSEAQKTTKKSKMIHLTKSYPTA